MTFAENKSLTFEDTTGKKPVGWLGPGLTQTLETPELLRKAGVLTTDNLTPQKARLLLALALTRRAGEVERIFAEY